MKRALIAAAVLSLTFALSAFAADNGQQQNSPGQNFEQRKAELLKMIDERIAGIQEAKTCVQAAKNHEDLKVCRDKHRAEMRNMRGEMGRRGGPGGPGGPMQQEGK
jgi:Flp pilus assembly protein TadD